MHRAAILILLIALCGFLSCEAVPAAESDNPPAIGTPVKEFPFTDIRYLPRTLADFGDRKAYVLVFTTLECPIARRSLPKLKELEADYRDRGVQFVAINVGPEDALVDVAYQAVRADIPFPFVKDFTGEVVAAVGATRTPECVVLDAQRRLRYRGRIDAQLRFSGIQPRSSREDLREALDDVLAGRDVRVPETPVDGCLISRPRQPQSRELTYHRDIAPLMQKHCQTCHQPGMAGPFSLLTVEDVSAHAEMIAEVVSLRRMPPWYAASDHDQFVNNLRLSSVEIDTIVDWAGGDMAVGNPDDAPSPLPLQQDQSDWNIGEPDLVLRMIAPEQIPAEGYIPYRYTVLPYVFLKDTWVQRIEINPGNDAVVHHCNMGYIKVTEANRKSFHPEQNFVTGYVPGGDPMVLGTGVGFRIPAGSVIGLQLHYVTTGEKTTDQTAVGFVFAKEPIQQQIRHFQCHTRRFAIPSGASHHKVTAAKTFPYDATGIGLYCHMHLRGKDMTFKATYPDGREETLLAVPNYNFDWQSSYRWPAGAMRFPKGTRIDCTAHYDNSAFNPFNPDPTATVHHGLQTYHEMMYGFLFFTRDDEALNLKIDPKTGHIVE